MHFVAPLGGLTPNHLFGQLPKHRNTPGSRFFGFAKDNGISPTVQQGEPAEIKAEMVRWTNGDRAS
jgi:hypothetical protein